MIAKTNSFTPTGVELPTVAELQPVKSSGWSAGFGNLFSKELRDWFGTKRWLVQGITWVAIMNGLVAFLMFILPIIERFGREAAIAAGEVPPPVTMDNPIPIGLSTFFTMAAIAGAVGVIILMQDSIVGEKQMGTAAWVMSKPVSRVSLILSKLAANAIGILVFVLALPAAITYAEISLAAGHFIDIVPYLTALPLVMVTLLFYLCLSLMLGVLFSQRGPLLSILFGILFGGTVVAGPLPAIASVLPINLGDSAGAIAAGAPLPISLVWTMLLTLGWCVLFMVVALRQFRHQEL